ncbi:legume-like lectin family-domain-containing protein [Protomyces lactucae-debilis]|uniref:Legume-like lectin family-domain-containing protein n=1 Tax=Protomyces lactucae-debilis TaxID=2754530 RepID=A0A1Y2FMB8_PROLT|nr:legume-like lectin family-domain-containing protein [Protomyces lactucae-debilis]ORY85110.1 legume-like lectin family-domain-containing protein [Protomyces lactucae-debilis]
MLSAAMATAQDDVRQVPLRTHSLQKPYLDQDFHSRWWDYGGTTVVDTANHIRLTYDRQHSTGMLWSRLPITATNYEIEFEFKIHGRGAGLFGDGMAMWLTTSSGEMGPVFGNKDQFTGLGIFIDTYKNGRSGVTFPYISAMLGNGQTAYDVQNDGQGTELAGCSARGIRDAPVPTKGRLTYYKDSYLKFELQYKSEGEWTECFTVPKVEIPNVAYLGFTAITGEVSDFHDIISVQSRNVFSSSSGPSAPIGFAKYKSSSHAGKGSWLGFLTKIVLFLLVCAAGLYGYQRYRKASRKQYRGFE